MTKRTRQTLRKAEFGFLGVVVYTRVHTPRFWGDPCRAGTPLLESLLRRGLRTSWLIVAIDVQKPLCMLRLFLHQSSLLSYSDAVFGRAFGTNDKRTTMKPETDPVKIDS